MLGQVDSFDSPVIRWNLTVVTVNKAAESKLK